MKILIGIMLGVTLVSCTVTHHVPRAEWERSRAAASPSPTPGSNVRHRSTTPSTGYHHVVKGDTLYAISWRYRLDYKQLAWWNQIRSPYRIGIGQRIRLSPQPGQSVLPPTANRTVVRPVEPSARPAPSPTVSTTPPKPAIIKPTEPQNTGVVSAPSNSVNTVELKWRWPVKGELLDRFGINPGIDIAGKYGQAVLASEAGKVVYSGRGLKGYGDLIIIKHNDTYLSAYAHNSRLLVKEGQRVYAGQSIAQLGKVAEIALLHFEIRVQGEPVDPLTFLPKN